MSRTPRGTLAIVLHTHMPYVEGFGTWPFGEEWLWEAMATSYLPLLDVVDAAPGRVTVSLTPVLCDQLEAPGVPDRFARFLRDVRPETHRLDLETARREHDPGVAGELERSAARYASAADAFARRAGDLVGAFAPHAAWTSAATHAVLPLLATDAGVRLQLETGIAGHRRRFGAWGGGLWLPECAHAPWLDPLLEGSGARAVCLDLTDVLGRGAPAQLRPLRSAAGPTLVPIDREVIELVWSDHGYPAGGAYRDSHRFTAHRHRPWAVDGSVYDPARALALVAADADDFVAHAAARVHAGGLCVAAVDTELLGHFWHEGPAWLAAVLDRAEAAGLAVRPLDEALADGAGGPPRTVPEALPVTSWGEPRTLATWSGPGARGLAWRQRAAELRVAQAAAGGRARSRALRELLAAQASDWAFLLTHDRAGEYPAERADGHLAALDAALDGRLGDELGPRNLAPQLAVDALATP